MSAVLERHFDCERICLASPGALGLYRGEPIEGVYWFFRTVGNEKLDAVIHVRRENEPLMPDVYESLCRRLQIPVAQLKHLVEEDGGSE